MEKGVLCSKFFSPLVVKKCMDKAPLLVPSAALLLGILSTEFSFCFFLASLAFFLFFFVSKQKAVLFLFAFFLGIFVAHRRFSTPFSQKEKGQFVGRIHRVVLKRGYELVFLTGEWRGEKHITSVTLLTYLKGFRPGMTLRIEGTVFPLPPEKTYLKRQGLQGLLKVQKLSYHPTVGWQGVLHYLREQLTESQKKLPSSLQVIYQALLLGRSSSSSWHWHYFLLTGTAHYFVTSGLHFAILWGIFLALFRLFSLSHNLQWSLPCLFLTLYLALLDFPLPASRAWVMLTGFTLSRLFHLPQNRWNLLGGSAFFLLLLWPESAFQTGFYLSFSAVATLFALPPTPSWISPFVASLAVFLTTAPITATSFGILTPATLFATPLLLPWVVLSLGFGFAYLLFFLLFPPLATPFLLLLSHSLSGLWITLKSLFQVMGYVLFVSPPTLWQIVLWYTALFLFFFPKHRLYGWTFLLFLAFFFLPSSPKGNRLLPLSSNYLLTTPSGGVLYLQGKLKKEHWKILQKQRTFILILGEENPTCLFLLPRLLSRLPLREVWISSLWRESAKEVLLRWQRMYSFRLRILAEGQSLTLGESHFLILSPPLLFSPPLPTQKSSHPLILFYQHRQKSFLLPPVLSGWTKAYLQRRYSFIVSVLRSHQSLSR